MNSRLIDLDNDGDLDAVSPHWSVAPGFEVSLNNGAGVFGPATTIGGAGQALTLAVGRVNAGVNADVVWSSGSSAQTFFGNGAGGFTPGPVSSIVAGSYGASDIGDYNGDSVADLVAVTNGSARLYAGNGTGSFTLAATIPISGRCNYSVITADFNKDAIADVAMSDNCSAYIDVLLSTGSGFTHIDRAFATGSGAGLGAGDINGDTYPDIAFNGSSAGILYFNSATQSFSPVTLAVTNGRGATVADFNGDGAVDVAAHNGNNNTETFFLNAGGGTFVTVNTSYAAGGLFQQAADLNGDGKADIFNDWWTSQRSIILSVGGVAPAVTAQPSDTSTLTGGSASFTASASGSPAPSIKWQTAPAGSSTFTDIAGATSTTLTLTGVTAAQNGSKYQAVFTNATSTATTNPATLTVNEAPAVTTQPSDSTHNAGETATFTAAASGLPAPTVQWESSTDGTTWTSVTGATSTTLTLTNVTYAQGGTQYRAVFTNSTSSVTTTAATLTVYPAPTTSDPADATVADRGSATFTATGTAAAGTPVPTVQWQVSTDGGTTFTNIVGETTDTLYLPNVYMADNGNLYRAVYTNTAGATPTASALLTVVQSNTDPAAPGGETAGAGGTGTSTITTIRTATTVVTGTSAATLTGTTRPFATVDLYGYTHPATTYTKLATTTADASGAYSFTPTVNAYSRFRVRVNGVTTASVTQYVRSTLAMTATKTGARTYVFTGTVAPHRANQLVTVYYVNAAGTRGVVGTDMTDANGRYRITRTFTSYGHHSYTAFAHVTTDTLTLRNHSASRTITTDRAR